MKRNVWILPCSVAVCLLTLWTACKKNTSSSDNSSSRVTLITQASWKYDTAGADLNRDGIIDIGDTTILPCFKDNTYLFNKDSTGIADNGALKCSPTDPQTFPFTWSFTSAGDSVLKSDADPLLAGGINIYSITSTKLILYKDTTALGIKLWYLVYLKH
jgi:hypothetical protein